MKKTKKTKTKAQVETPFPKIGETWHFTVQIFDLWSLVPEKKKFEKNMERLIAEKNIDLERAVKDIQEPTINAFSKVIPKDFSKSVSVFLNESFDIYKNIVITECTPFRREDTLNWLIDVSLPIFTHIFKNLQADFDNGQFVFPEKPYWFLPEKNNDDIVWPIEFVVKWLNDLNGTGTSLNQTIIRLSDAVSGEVTISDDSKGKTIKKWMKNRNLPKIENLRQILKDDKMFGGDEKLKQSVVTCLFFGRAVHSIFNQLIKKYGKNVTFKWVERFKESTQKTTIYDDHFMYPEIFQGSNKAMDLNSDEAFLKFIEFSDFELLKKLTGLGTPKEAGDKNKAEKLINELKKIKPYNKRLSFFIHWNQARLHILMNEPEKALKSYDKAFETGKYRAGTYQKQIIRECLIVSGKMKKKQIFKKVYKWSSYYDKENLFSENFDNIADGFMNAQADNYRSMFHSSAFYPEAKSKKNEQHFNGVVYWPDLENRKLDLRYPDRMIKNIFPRPITQLMLFSALGQADKIKKLLEKGADPNKKASGNSTALISATGNQQGQECARLLLDHDKIAESINAMTHRQKKTALSNAIELGDAELVQLLVAKGADLNLKATTNEYTPLYQAISQLYLPEYYANLKDDPTWQHKNFDPAKAGITLDSMPPFLRGPMVFDDDYANAEFQSRHRMKENSYFHSSLCQAMGSIEIDKRGLYHYDQLYFFD